MKPKKEERILLMHKWTVTRRSLMAALLVSCPGTRRRSDCRQAGHRSFVGGWKDRLHARATYHHEHVLPGAQGLGKNGTAGEFKAPWKIILLMYNPEVANSKTFTPVTSASDVDAAEANGVFLPINPGSANPFEIETGSVLICPFVSPNA